MTHDHITQAITGFRDMSEVRSANRQLGHLFFDPAALRFFGSRVHSELHGGCYFVTSERDEAWGSLPAAWNGERRYTVRQASADGSIVTVGEFGEYRSASAAHAAAARFAGKGDA